MKRLADFDPAELVEGPEGTVRWAPNDAYAQAHGNKLEYVGRVRGVRNNILPLWGNIHTYYTPSQARSQNTPIAIISEMIERALQAKEEHHKQEIEELLAKQREEINQQHKQQMDAMTTAITV
jgi:hypothetical protein